MVKKKVYIPIGLCLVLLVIGFLALRSDVPDEPIVIYKATTPLPKQTAIRDTTPSTPDSDVQAERTPTTDVSDDTSEGDTASVVPSEPLETAAPTDIEAIVDAQDIEVPVSPHGFGVYPEVSDDFPLLVDWTDRTEQQELLMRVMIQAWADGERFVGGNMIDGKVRLNFPNTVYVRYKEIPTAEGSVISTRVIVGATDVEVPPPGEDFPPGVRVLDFDEAGIDPYEYLDLP